MSLSQDDARNQLHWDTQSDDYQAAHGDQLRRNPLAWGVWSISEDELQILGDVSGKDVPRTDGSFDVIFCDHGAMTYADPVRTVPEAARLLR